MEVQGKLVIITGSAQGLGRAFAVKLLEGGASVCISDVNTEIGDKTATELGEKFGKDRIHFIQCNVLQKQDIVDLYEGCEKHFGRSVDIFCNNAGINHIRGWKLCMDIDIMAVMECTEYVMDRMDTSKGGSGGLIVNTASLAGIVNGLGKDAACYHVAKHGVVSLTRSLGTKRVLRETGVRVQCICPAFADTAILSDVGDGTKSLIQKKYGLMTPEFVAEAFMKLITRCNNGDALCVMTDIQPFVYPDISKNVSIALALGSKVFYSLFGVDVFTVKHQAVYFTFIFICLHLITNFLLSFLF